MYIYKRLGSRGHNIVFVYVAREHVHDAHPWRLRGTKIYNRQAIVMTCYTKLYRFDSRGFYIVYLKRFAVSRTSGCYIIL